MNRLEIITGDILSQYFNILKKNKTINLDHIDTSDDEPFYIWDIYYIPNTPFRLLISLTIDDSVNICNVALTVEIDNDCYTHIDFADIVDNYQIYDFDISTKQYDKEIISVRKELQIGVDKQIDTLRNKSQKILKTIEAEITGLYDDDTISAKIETNHGWLIEEWVYIANIIEFAGLSIAELPKLISFYKLDTDLRFIT